MYRFRAFIERLAIPPGFEPAPQGCRNLGRAVTLVARLCQVTPGKDIQRLAVQGMTGVRSGRGEDIGATSVLGREPARLVQQAVCPRHSVEVDAQISGKLPDGRELIAWLQGATAHLLLHLLYDLSVDRQTRAKI